MTSSSFAAYAAIRGTGTAEDHPQQVRTPWRKPGTLNGMTAETVPARARPARAESLRQRMVRRRIQLAVVIHILRDRRFQETVITAAIVAVALAELGRDNEVRPVRRLAARYKSLGVSQELARARRALEPGKS
jgi:hypothetical protein